MKKCRHGISEQYTCWWCKKEEQKELEQKKKEVELLKKENKELKKKLNND